MSSGPGVVRVTARGHPGVTARHAKTLELTAAPGITARASCVLGVAAAFPPQLRGLRGTVRLDLAVGELTAAVTGEANPGYAAAGHLIVRRSDVLDPDTFLVHASAAAADLPRPLAAALADPAAVLTLTATEVGTPAPVVLVLGPGAVPAGVAELVAAADLVVDLTGAGAPAPVVPLPVRRLHAVPATAAGARTVVVLADGPDAVPADRLAAAVPGARVLTWPPAYPGAELLLAAGRPVAPVLQAGPLPATATGRRALAAAVAAVPYPAVVGTAGDGVDALRELLPEHAVLLPDPAVGHGTGAVTVPPGGSVDASGLRRSPALVLLPPAGRRPVGTDAAALAGLLRAEGVSGRTAAAVLAALGVPRKEAYRMATGG